MPCCIDRMRFSPRFSIRKFYFPFFFLRRLRSVSGTDLRKCTHKWVNVQGHSYAPGCPCYPIKIFESNLGTTHLTFGNLMLLMWPTNKRPTMHRPREKEKKDKSFLRQTIPLLFLCKIFFLWTRVQLFSTTLVIRSYHGESTASHPNCEVKHRWARSVLW